MYGSIDSTNSLVTACGANKAPPVCPRLNLTQEVCIDTPVDTLRAVVPRPEQPDLVPRHKLVAADQVEHLPEPGRNE
jgi:hypothetical protein